MQEQRLPVGIDQQLVREWVSYQLSKRGPVRCNLVAIMGDELRLRMEGDGVLHVGYQNIRGSEMFSGLEVAPKLTVMCGIGADIRGISEINRPWEAGNKALYRL